MKHLRYLLLLICGQAFAAPTFTAGPAVSGTTTTTYTQSATPSASATWYAVAYIVTASAPTCTQIKAGQNSSGVSAIAAANKAITAADTLVLTIPGGRPIHNIASCLNNGTGDSAVTTLTNQLLSAPTGKQFSIAAVPWTGGTDSVFTSASPAVANGDVWKSDLLTTPDGYAITDYTDGNFTIATAGDLSIQTFVSDVFDISLDSWYGTFTTYVNDSLPFVVGQPPNLLTAQTGMAITPINWNSYFGDNDDPTLTISVSPSSTDTLPAALSLTTGVLSGSVTAASTKVLTFRATDAAGETVDSSPWTITASTSVTVPNVIGETTAQAITDLTAANLLVPGQGIAYAHSAVVANGLVVIQTPAAGTSVAPSSDVALVQSLGKAGVPGMGLRLEPYLH